jgi:hypothetical protein
MGPPGGDFGALFGAGAGGKTIENRWTWKAAGAQPVVTEKNSNGWNWGANSSEPPAKICGNDGTNILRNLGREKSWLKKVD